MVLPKETRHVNKGTGNTEIWSTLFLLEQFYKNTILIFETLATI